MYYEDEEEEYDGSLCCWEYGFQGEGCICQDSEEKATWWQRKKEDIRWFFLRVKIRLKNAFRIEHCTNCKQKSPKIFWKDNGLECPKCGETDLPF